LASPFLSPDFAVACAHVLESTRVAVFSLGDGGTGFFPFQSSRHGFGKALGQGFSDAQAIVAPPTADVDIRSLLDACGLRLWEFDHLLAWQGPWLKGAHSRWTHETSPVIDVTAGWAVYQQAQRRASTSLLSSTSRKRRKLERDFGPVSLAFHEPDRALLEQLLKWKSAQYRRTGQRDVFADERMRRLVHDLLDSDSPEFGAPLTVLRAGDEVVAVHLGLRSSTALAWWFPVYADRFRTYSPGLILCLDLVRAMGAEGLTSLDLGEGDEPYKRRLANSEIPLLRGTVSPYWLTSHVDAARRWPREFVRQAPRLREFTRDVRLRLGAAQVRRADPSTKEGGIVGDSRSC
jgi:CelD/BcsL family acetyltransferase involved in cellulose biosynthesis